MSLSAVRRPLNLPDRASRPLDAAVTVGLVVLVVTFAAASSSLSDVVHAMRPARWVVLAAFCVLAVLQALVYGSQGRLASFTPAVGAAFVALALVSAAWSVGAAATLGRGAAFAVVLITAVALAHTAAASQERLEQMLAAVFAGAALVGLAGAFVLALHYDAAVLPSLGGSPPRYQGFGGNPNTVPLLAAVVLPIGVWWFTVVRGALRRAAVGLGIAVLFLTIVFADSRGALVASFVGLIPVVLGLAGRRRALAAMAVLVAVYAAGIGLGRLPHGTPLPGPLEIEGVASAAVSDDSDLACVGLPPDRSGQPPCGSSIEVPPRSLIGDSGRLAAWRQALGQVAERPLVGYGFGSESDVFANRVYGFTSAYAESSYVGVALQLGVVGSVLSLVLLVLVLARLRFLRSSSDDLRGPAGAAGGALLAGVLLAGVQSYLYAAGGIATPVFWITAFLFVAATAARVGPVRRLS
jgi:O-antigen ligase